MSQLPLTVSTTLPDGTQVLGVHASPSKDDGLGFHVDLSDAELLEVLGDCDADLIFGGHHHRPLDVMLNGQRIINIGSVSNPMPPDLRASYVLLEADETGYEVTFHRVDYDREAVVADLKRLRHPGAKYIIGHLRGPRP